MKKILFNFILPVLALGLFYVWCATVRARCKNPEAERAARDFPGGYILTLWHNRIFFLLYYMRRKPDYHFLISPSRDGDFIARIAKMMGYSVVRGSSFKQAVPAGRSLVRLLQKGERIVIIGDGSRGPRYKLQPGCVHLACISGVPVIPLTYGSKNKWTLNSWDRFEIPRPFTQCAVNFGSPIYVPKDAGESVLATVQNEIEERLNRITAECE